MSLDTPSRSTDRVSVSKISEIIQTLKAAFRLSSLESESRESSQNDKKTEHILTCVYMKRKIPFECRDYFFEHYDVLITRVYRELAQSLASESYTIHRIVESPEFDFHSLSEKQKGILVL